jgi:hypothetical protein
MAIAEIQLPDGRIAELEVPDNFTPEQVIDFANTYNFPSDPPKTETIYDTQRKKTYELPANLDVKDVNYAINKHEEPDALYFGKTKMDYLHQSPNTFQELIKSVSLGNLGQALEIGVEENREPAREFLDEARQSVKDTPENVRRGAVSFVGTIGTYLGGNLFVMADEVADGILKKNMEKLNKGEVPDFMTNPFDMALVLKSAFVKNLELKKFGEELKEDTSNWIKSHQADQPTKDNFYNNFIFDLTQGLGFGGAGTIGVLTGNPVMMAGLFSLFQTSVSYEESRLSGKSELESLKIGTGAGMIEGALSFVGFNFMAKAFQGSGVLKMATQNAMINATEELAQSFSNSAWMNYNDVRDDTLMEVVKSGIYESLIGGVVGLITGGGVGVTKAIVNRRIKDNEELREKFTDEEIEQISESIDSFVERNKEELNPVNVLREEFKNVRKNKLEISKDLEAVIKDFVERKPIVFAPENLNIEKDFQILQEMIAQAPVELVNPKEQLAKIAKEVNDLERLSMAKLEAITNNLREEYARELASEKDSIFLNTEELKAKYKEEGKLLDENAERYLDNVIGFVKAKTEAQKEMKGKKSVVEFARKIGGLADNTGDLAQIDGKFRESKKRTTLFTRDKKKSNKLVKAVDDSDITFMKQGVMFVDDGGGSITRRGVPLDEFGLMLYEEGYFSHRLTPDEVLQVIDEELNGGIKVYSTADALDAYIELNDMLKNQGMQEAYLDSVISEIDKATRRNNEIERDRLLEKIKDEYGEDFYNTAKGLRDISLTGADPFTREIGKIRKLLAESARARRQISKVEQKANNQILELSKKLRVDAMSEDIPLEVARARRYTIGDRIKFFKDGMEQGAINAKKETQMVQKEIARIIADSELGSADKGEFLKALPRINTLKKYNDYLDNLLSSIEKVELKRKLERVDTQIKKELKKTTGIDVGSGGRKVGRYTPSIQNLLDKIKKITQDNQVDFENMGIKIEGNKEIPLEIRQYNELIDLAIDYRKNSEPDSKEKLENRRELLASIKALKAEGKVQNKKSIGYKIAIREGAKELAVNDIKKLYNKYNGKVPNNHFKNIANTIKKKIGKLSAYTIESWLMSENYMNRTFFATNAKTTKILDLNIEVENMHRIKSSATSLFQDAFSKAYNMPKEKMLSKLASLKGKKYTFNEIDPLLNKPYEFNKLQLMTIYNHIKNVDVKERYLSEEGNNFSEAFIDEMIDTGLDKQDKAFADELVKIYEVLYEGVNETHEALTNLTLPKIENYTPIKGENATISHFVETLFGAGFGTPSSKSKSFVKLRGDKGAIVIEDSIDIFTKYVHQASHYVAFAEKMDIVNAIFKTPEVKKLAIEMFGEKYWSASRELRDYVNRGGQVFGNKSSVDDLLLTLGKNMTRAMLFFKPFMVPKQASSFLAYADRVPYGEFGKITSKLLANPKEFKRIIDIIQDTPMMKVRGDNIQMDLIKLGKAKDFTKKGVWVSKYDELGGYFIKVGDRSAIYMGGAVYYKYLTDNGVSHKNALREVVKFTNETQQSTDINQISAMSQNTFGHLFMAFLSSPVAYQKKGIMAVRDASRGDINSKQLAKTYFLFNSILAGLFSWVSSGFIMEEDKLIDSAILGHWKDLPFYGWLLGATYNVNKYGHSVQRSLNNILSPAVAENITRAGTIFDAIVREESKKRPNEEKLGDLQMQLFIQVSGILGAPSSAIQGSYDGYKAIVKENNTEKGLKRISGLPRSVSELSYFSEEK